MSFLANESPPAVDAEPTITNDGWFPDVEPATVRDQARFDGTVTAARLKQAILIALSDINGQLASYKQQRVLEGHATLAAVPGADLGEIRVWIHLYNEAVLAHLQAHFAETYRQFDTTGQGDKKADPLEVTADQHRRNLHWAIAAIAQRPRATVELI
jgi:hypothetical protein